MVPPEYCGLVLTLRALTQLSARVARLTKSMLHRTLVHALTRFATTVIAWRNWVPSMAPGACGGAFVLAEACSGSDFEQIATIARVEVGGYC
jgi:alkylation response protein AidB-like acyl-CoA dehydrogenase